MSGVSGPLLQHQHFGQRRLDIGHCPPADRRPNHDPRPMADWIHHVAHLVSIASEQHGYLGIVLVVGGDPDAQPQGASGAPCRQGSELIQRERRVKVAHTRHGCIFAMLFHCGPGKLRQELCADVCRRPVRPQASRAILNRMDVPPHAGPRSLCCCPDRPGSGGAERQHGSAPPYCRLCLQHGCKGT